MGEKATGYRSRGTRFPAIVVAAVALSVAGLTACEDPYFEGDGVPSESVESPAPDEGGTEGGGGGGKEPGGPAEETAAASCAEAPDASSGDDPGGAPPVLDAGETYGYANGLEVTVGEAEPYTPSAEADDTGERVYRFLVTVDNCGDTANETIFAFQGWAGGMEATEIYDPALAVDPVGVLAPGETFAAYVVFDVPAGPDWLDVIVDPLPAELEHSYWALGL
ncbi:hypothetical protein SAMN05421773_101258 [Streptomyces aidingensis]|uniref:DUF4352 domain-containing protein n=2 Tax=Streptomyces aidingensis TaxID=910347 RepID=A0A1I1EDA2_9ACTN|nr:hypothetical protein SAMN05421773_101258 [Streptomyces aidingensis]